MITTLFRGKPISNLSEPFVVGDLIHYFYDSGQMSFHIQDAYGYKTRIAPETLSQFTDIIDLNNKMIFECDILGKINKENNKIELLYGFVLYDKAQFVVYDYECHVRINLYDHILTAKSVVVGNIWDNPELYRKVD